jgi:hypothetical protein
MGNLKIRIKNITCAHGFKVSYKVGTTPYPLDTGYTDYNTYTNGTTTIIFDANLQFDTQYWVKITDTTTNRYIIENIYMNDSKTFSCYDTIKFDVDAEATCIQ